MLGRFAEIFETAEVGGLRPEAHERLVARMTGLPVITVRTGVETSELRGREAGTLWRRRGAVFAVRASGNHPAVHSLGLDAIALDYRVAIRPSSRDPFTAHRLVLAVRAADRTPLLAQGPGRVKVLITGRWEDHLDSVADSVCGLVGVCLNATGVLIEHDAAGFAEAHGQADFLRSRAAGAAPRHTYDIVHGFGDGSAALRPAVHYLPGARAAQLGLDALPLCPDRAMVEDGQGGTAAGSDRRRDRHRRRGTPAAGVGRAFHP